MPVAFRASANASVDSATLTITDPGNTGDFLIGVLASDTEGETLGLPDGTWNILFTDLVTFDGEDVWIIWKQSSAGGSGSLSFTNGGGGSFAGVIRAYSGVAATGAINDSGNSVNSSGVSSPGTVTAPSISPTVPNCMLVWLAGIDANSRTSGDVWTAPTLFGNLGTGGDGEFAQCGSADELISGTGATGTIPGTFTLLGATFGYAAYLIALAPAGGGTTLTLSGGAGSENPGALSSSTSLTPSGGRSLETAGANVIAGTFAVAGGRTSENPGAENLAGTLTPSGGQSAEAPGALNLSGLLALAGGLSSEQASNLAIALALLLSGGASSEAPGAESLSGSLLPTGGATGEAPGALSSSTSLALAGGRSGETPGAQTLAALLALAGAPSSEAPGVSLLSGLLTLAGAPSAEQPGAVTLAIGLITLLLSGGISEERAGAIAQSAVLALSGTVGEGAAGANNLLGTLAPLGGASGEQPGATSVATTGLLSGGASSEGAGFPSLSTLLALSGGASGETSGAVALAVGVIFLLLSGAGSSESPGASTATSTLALTGGASGEVPGAENLSGILLPVGGASAERTGALTLLQTLLLASGQSDERAGASNLLAILSLAGGGSSERAGADLIAQLLFLAGGASGERAGNVQRVIPQNIESTSPDTMIDVLMLISANLGQKTKGGSALETGFPIEVLPFLTNARRGFVSVNRGSGEPISIFFPVGMCANFVALKSVGIGAHAILAFRSDGVVKHIPLSGSFLWSTISQKGNEIVGIQIWGRSEIDYLIGFTSLS